MPDIFGTPIDEIPNAVIAEPPTKPTIPAPPPAPAKPRITNHTCIRCGYIVNTQDPRTVITTFSKADSMKKHSDYYHEGCTPLVALNSSSDHGVFKLLISIFGRYKAFHSRSRG